MKRFQLIRMAAVLAIALGWLAAGSRQALAGPETSPSVTGEWRGFYTSAKAQESGVIHEVGVAINEQRDRRFAGWLALGDSWYEINGTIAASGTVNIVGSGEHDRLVANFELHDFGGGAAIFDGRLKSQLGDRTTDEGRLILLRSYPFDPAEPPPDISGEWLGTYTSAVSGLTGTYRSIMSLPKGSSTFTGFAVLDEDTADEQFFPLVGTINGDGDFKRIGQNDIAELCVGGRLILPDDDDAGGARIDAIYILKYADGSEDTGTLEQEVTPFPVAPDDPPEDEPVQDEPIP